MTEQRVHFRMDLQTEAWIADVMGESWQPVTPLNMSAGGIAFASSEKLAADALRRFRFYLPGNPKLINLVIKIGYSRPHAFLPGFRIGSSFAKIRAEDLAMIRQFIDEQLVLPVSRFPTAANTPLQGDVAQP